MLAAQMSDLQEPGKMVSEKLPPWLKGANEGYQFDVVPHRNTMIGQRPQTLVGQWVGG